MDKSVPPGAAVLLGFVRLPGSFPMPEERDGRSNNNNQDTMNTGSVTRDGTGDLEDQKDCREGTGGGARRQEMGTEVK